MNKPIYKLLDWIDINKLDWNNLSRNKRIFKLDYEKMRKNFEDMEEEILKVVLHPKRVFRYLEEYGYDVDDMYD